MPSANKTEVIQLNQWQLNEYPKMDDFNSDNLKIDNKFKVHDTQLSDMAQDSYTTVIATGTNSYIGSSAKIKSLGKGTTKLTLFVATDATGSCSLNLNSYGAKNIKDSFGNIVTNLKKDIPYNICYNGTDFILQGKGGGGNATKDQVLNGIKVTVDSGPMVGEMPNNGALNASLNCGGSYNIPSGFTTGGKVTANSLASQTADATAVAADIVLNKTAYINGSKVSGQATIASLGGRKVANNTVTSSASTASFVRIDGTVENYPYVTVSGLSFRPSFIWLKYAVGGAEYQVIYSNVGVTNGLYTAEVFFCGYFAYGQSSTPHIMKADAGGTSITTGGFTLPVMAASAVWAWVAYE